jgi:Protein of unknown function (DUF429)
VGSRIIAVDWSGDLTSAHRKMWLAEITESGLRRLECGRSREELTDHLIDEAHRDPRLIVGLDFAFSFPAWFLEARGIRSAPELWALADREAQAWLAACEPPFWGRKGVGRTDPREPLRRTDKEVPTTAGIRPQSVFQIGGAGAVGTGSIRGMRFLRRLRSAGFSIWPFDPPGWPRVVEIYPRLLTGPVRKSSAAERQAYLKRFPTMDEDFQRKAEQNDDAFDAAISALVMAKHLGELLNLPAVADRQIALEGSIWYPLTPAAACRTAPAR